MIHNVRAIVNVELQVYVDDEKCDKSNAQIIQEGKRKLLNGEGEIVDDFEVKEHDITGIWLDHSVYD